MGGFHHQKKCQNTFFGNTQEKGGGCFHRDGLTFYDSFLLPTPTARLRDRKTILLKGYIQVSDGSRFHPA
jgi:hypothetical protein